MLKRFVKIVEYFTIGTNKNIILEKIIQILQFV